MSELSAQETEPPGQDTISKEADKGMDGGSTPQKDAKEGDQIPQTQTLTQGNPGSTWLGWLSRTAAPEEKIVAGKGPDAPPPPSPTGTESLKAPETVVLPPLPGDSSTTPAKRTWMQMLSGGPAKEVSVTIDQTPPASEPVEVVDTKEPGTSESLISGFKVPSVESTAPPALPGDGSKSAGWVFWSSDRRALNSSTSVNEPHVGEIAVSDTPSQKRPKRASISLKDSDRPKSQQSQKDTPKQRGSPNADQALSAKSGANASLTPTRGRGSSSGKDHVETPKSGKFPAPLTLAAKQLSLAAPNLLLPSFADTFSGEVSPNLLQMLGRLLSYSKPPDEKHLYRTKDSPKIKSALAIGVHGFFPSTLFRTVLGQPTGTSIKFADMAAKAIKKWTHSRGYACEVKTAALEGEGRISERVDLLWKLLLNWIDEIRKADFVLIACHSQGVPVATMLVAKLVNFGCINSARVGICAMAGVSLGPFPELQSRWISGSVGELFEFSNPASAVSKDYLHAVEVVLKFGVRLVYIGSIDDQLVSLESSIFSPISHPHIYRAAFVDGRIHAPNFLVHLVGFALKLRNLGVQDHGLIRELSSPLAGSLYTGEGHSRIYEDDAVYDLAVQFALETNAIANAPLSQTAGPAQGSNPYILPWAVRGILEEDFVKSDLHEEANQLLKQFDEWKPTTKALKDVKFRLEGIRSKL